jgi:hypothetical protein
MDRAYAALGARGLYTLYKHDLWTVHGRREAQRGGLRENASSRSSGLSAAIRSTHSAEK